MLHVILAPVVARSLKCPHVVRLGVRVSLLRTETMLLHSRLIDPKIRGPRISVSQTDQRDIGEVVINFDRSSSLNGRSCCGGMCWNFHAPPATQLPRCIEN